MTAVFKHISDEPDSAAKQTSAAESVTGEPQYSGMQGHLQGSVPAHEALRLVVNTRAGRRPDDRLQ